MDPSRPSAFLKNEVCTRGGDYLFTRYQNGGEGESHTHCSHYTVHLLVFSPFQCILCGLLWCSFLYPLKCGFIEWEGKRKKKPPSTATATARLLLGAWISPWMGHFSVGCKGGKRSFRLHRAAAIQLLGITNSLRLLRWTCFSARQAVQFPCVSMCVSDVAFTLARSLTLILMFAYSLGCLSASKLVEFQLPSGPSLVFPLPTCFY